MNKSLEEQVADLAWKWQNRLALREWKVNIIRTDTNHDDDPDIEMEIAQDRKYLEATITVYNAALYIDKEGLERVVIHELLHLSFGALNEFLAPAGDDALEEAIQRLAVAIYHSHE